jgi:hypothetical protein
VLRVKRGEVRGVGHVVEEINQVQTTIEQLLDAGRTPLPAEPDLDRVSAWSITAHRRHWNWT